MAKSADAFRTISEVSELLDVPAHVLRFWESRFTQIKPVKRAGGRRYYRPADVELIAGLKKLLHEDGMSIRDAQKLIRAEGVRHVAALVPVDLGGEEAEADAPETWPEAPALDPAPASDATAAFPHDPEDQTVESTAPELEAPPEPIAEPADERASEPEPAPPAPWPEAPTPEPAPSDAGLAPDPEDAEAPQTILSPTASWTQPSLFGEAPMAENVEPPKASAKIVSLRLEPRAPRPARAPAQAATPATPDLLDTIPPGPSTRLRRLRAAQFTPEELAHLRSLQARMSALHERLSPARR